MIRGLPPAERPLVEQAMEECPRLEAPPELKERLVLLTQRRLAAQASRRALGVQAAVPRAHATMLSSACSPVLAQASGDGRWSTRGTPSSAPPARRVPAASSLTPGYLFGGKYHLLRRIAVGPTGAVWAARNQLTQREVALKLLFQPDRELHARFAEEARAYGRVQHRNVVTVYDAGATEREELFLVMELLQGETLASLLKRRRRMAPPEAARIGRDIARGLAAAHRIQVTHRDLKPSNVFLSVEGGTEGYTVKLLDFGISTLVGESGVYQMPAGLIVGSLAYMSPEQLMAAADVDARSDLWSLGVMLFEMLSGERPFRGAPPQIVMQVVGGQAPELAPQLRELAPGLSELIMACLRRDREQRPASAADVAAELDACTIVRP